MKKRAALQITVPEPCTQAWEDMYPVQGGRHCAQCQKVVLDFTRMTDAQLLAYFNTSGTGCGQFRREQLGRIIKEVEVQKPNWWTRIAAGLLFAIGLSKGTEAQTIRPPIQTVQKNIHKKEQPKRRCKETTITALSPTTDLNNHDGKMLRGEITLDRLATRPLTANDNDTLYVGQAHGIPVSTSKVDERRNFWKRLKHPFK